MRIGRYYIAGMIAFGVLAGLLLVTVPSVREWPVPSLVWPLIAALVVDLAVMGLFADRVEPLTMNERAVAVIGSALVITLMLELA